MSETTPHSEIPIPQGAALLIPEAQSVAPFKTDKLTPLLLRFLNRLKQTGKSVHTISAYRNDLSTFCQFLIEECIDPRDFQSRFQDRWTHYLVTHGRKSPASIRRALMSARTFLHFLIKEKIIERSPLLEAKSPKQPAHELLVVKSEHYHTLVNRLSSSARSGDPKAIRDLALIQLLGECGLKASEAAQIKWCDILVEGQPSDEGCNVTIRIAGQNERMVKGDSGIAKTLSDLRSARIHLSLSAEPQDKLFFGFLNVSRRLKSGGLHRHGVKFVIYEVCEEIIGVPYNSESLRNHAIMRWLDMGLSSQQVAQLAGYSSLNSLERFRTKAGNNRRPMRKTRKTGIEGNNSK
ncbi:MAG: tyrosine-type recombinase/integrase [Silvanigrellaceae bacterium]